MAQGPIDLDRGAEIRVDASVVPEHLRPLIPLVARWAFGRQEDQDAFTSLMLTERPAEVAVFNAAVDAHRADIVNWGTAAGLNKHKLEMTDADWQHPYWHFLTLLKLRELTGPAPEVWPGQATAVRERIQAEVRRNQFACAWQAADDAFRRAAYAEVVSLLSSFEDMLSTSQKSKLSIARKRSGAGQEREGE